MSPERARVLLVQLLLRIPSHRLRCYLSPSYHYLHVVAQHWRPPRDD